MLVIKNKVSMLILPAVLASSADVTTTASLTSFH